MSLPRYDGSVLDNTPRPVPGAQIYVYTQPVSFTTTNWTPAASGLATVYNDNAGANPVTLPLQASNNDPTFDGNAAYYFYAAAGLYTLVITGGTLQSPVFLLDQALITTSGGITLLTNGVANSTQTLLNIAAGTGINASEASGTVTLAATQQIALQHNGTSNGSQATLNLANGTGIGITDNGTGTLTIRNTSVATVEVNGTPVGNPALLNLAAGAGITITDGGTGTITFKGVPVYNADGTTVSNPKLVRGTATLSGGTATVNLTGSAIFSNTAYQVIANIPSAVVSTSQFTLNGNGALASVYGLNITSNVLTVTCNTLFTAGQSITFTGMDTATSFLNGQTVIVSTAAPSGSNYVFTAPFTHADYGKNATVSNVALTSNVLTITTSATHSFTANSIVSFSGVGTATWLNGQTVTIASVGSNTFTAPFTHINYVSAADTGTVADADTGNVGTTTSGNVPWVALGN